MHFLNCPIGRGVLAFERTWIFAKTLRAWFFIECVARFFHATPAFRVAVYAEIRCCEYCQKQMTTTEHGTPLRFPRRSNPVSCELKPFPFIFLKKYKLSPIPLYFLKECQGFCSFPCIYLGNCKSFAIPFYFLIQDMYAFLPLLGLRISIPSSGVVNCFWHLKKHHLHTPSKVNRKHAKINKNERDWQNWQNRHSRRDNRRIPYCYKCHFQSQGPARVAHHLA